MRPGVPRRFVRCSTSGGPFPSRAPTGRSVRRPGGRRVAARGSGRGRVRRSRPDPASCRSVLFRGFFTAVLDEFADAPAGPVESRTNRADRNLQCARDLVVTQLLPDEEQQRVPLAVRKLGDRLGDRRPALPSVDVSRDPVGKSVDGLRGGEPRGGLDPPRLGPPMPCDQVGGDAVQPGTRVRPARVERGPSFERDTERLAEQLVGGIAPDSTYEESEQDTGMPVVDGGERRGPFQRRPDRTGVGAGVHREIFADPATRFAAGPTSGPRVQTLRRRVMGNAGPTNPVRRWRMTKLENRPNTALLVVDVQTCVVEAAYERDAVVANVGTLVDRARREGVPVVWVQHSDDDIVRGSDRWRIVAELDPDDEEPLVEKHYGDSFEDTKLETVLSDLGVGRLVVVGAQTDACVRSTLHGAFVRGYDATLVSDAHTTEDQSAWGAPPPEQVIAHTNLYWRFQQAPGRTAGTVQTKDVDFSSRV